MQQMQRSVGLGTWAALFLAPLAAFAQLPAPPAGKVIVSDVVIQGNRLVSAETIRNQMKTRVGREYIPEVLQEDVRTLFATRQFANLWANRVDNGPGRVRIIVNIRDYPNLVNKVTYQGNRILSRDDLESVTNIRPSTPL